ncbi:unnamed protein product [Calypogeia fissa]
MAPGRKKGGGALKAAAARREWNVGDLVLAKVRGFPAWPAQVSNAEERGIPPNPNKIFVSFFGTDQYRFCHYSEILPFTPRERSGLIGKLQQKNLLSDLGKAIKEICKADDERKDENRVQLNEGALENVKQQEDGNLSHAEDKLGAADVEGSDEKPDSDPASPGARSSDDRSTGALGLKEERQSKPDREPEQEIAKVNSGNHGARGDEGKQDEADVPTIGSTLESKPSQVSVKGGDSFDADQVHYYRKKVRKPVKEEEKKPQEVAPVVDKQPTPPITESPKGGAQPTRRAAFGKALKRLNSSSEKKPPEPVVISRGNFRKNQKYKQRRYKNRGEAMRNGGAAGSSKAVVSPGADMEDDDVDLASPLQKKGRRFGKQQSKVASRGGVDLQGQSVVGSSDHGEEHTTELCVENRLVEERADSSALSPVSAGDSADLESGRNQGWGRVGVGRGSNTHARKKGNFADQDREDFSTADESDEAKESDDADSDYNDEDYEYGKAAAVMSDRRKKRIHKPTKSYFKSSKKVKMAGGTSPKEVSVTSKPTDTSARDSKASDLREKSTILPPKAAKYRIRSSLPDDEAVLPPSKRWHPAFEAASASELEVALTHVGEPGNSKSEAAPVAHVAQDGSEQKQNMTNAKGSETKSTPRKGVPALGKSCSVSRAAVFTTDVLESSPLSKLPSNVADGKETVKKEKVGDGKLPAKVPRSNSLPARVVVSVQSTKGQNEKSHTKGGDQRKVSSDKQGKAGDAPKVQSDKSQVKLKTYKARKPVTSPRKESTGSHVSPQSRRVDEALYVDKTSQEGSVKQPLPSSQSNTPGKAAPGTPNEKGKGLSSGISIDAGRINGVKLEGFTSPVKLRPEVPENKLRQAVEAAKETKQKSLQGDGSASSMSLKYLIAAAQAKRQARQVPVGADHSGNVSDKVGTGLATSPSPTQGRGSSRFVSPVQHVPSLNPQDAPKSSGPYAEFLSPNDSVGGRSGRDKTSGAQPSGSRDGEQPIESTEAAIARDSFTGMLETLSRTKESIGRASHHALECVKHGIAEQIVEIIVEKLENEPSFHRRVDLFFLVDSITQCSHSSKGVIGAAFPPIVKEALPRLLNAAAPPGSSARENRRQCLKVLKLWLERGILPEQVLRHFITEIEAHNDDKSSVGNSRRPSRSERAVDDPLREMEGMFVDEYGSNASFALAGLNLPRMFEDDEEGSDGDGGKHSDKEDAALPSHPEETKDSSVPPEPEKQEEVEKHCHVLEAVDGELEMEDVSPSENDIKARREETLDESPPHPASSTEGQAAAVSDVSESSMAGSPPPPLPQGPPPPPPPPSGSPPSPPPLPASPPPSPPPPPPSPPATTAEEQSPVQSNANHSHGSLQAVQTFTPVGKPLLRETEQPRPGIFTPFTPQPIQVTHSVVPSYGSSSTFPNAQVSTRPNGPNLASSLSYGNLGPPISPGLAPALNSHGPPSAYAAAHAKHLAQSAAHAQHVAQTATHLHGPHNSHHSQSSTQVPRMQNVGHVSQNTAHVGQGSVHVPQTSPHIPQNTSHAPPLALGNPGFAQRPYMQPLKPLPGGPPQSSTQFGVDQEKVSPHLRQRHDSATDRAVESGLSHVDGRPMPVPVGSALPTEGHMTGESTGGGAQFLSGSTYPPPDQVYRMNNGMMRPSHVPPTYSSGHVNMHHPVAPPPFAQPPFRHSAPMQGNMPGNMLIPSPPFQYGASLPGTMPQGGTVPPPPPPQGHMLNFRPGGPTPTQWRPS